jgi:hypothetical protein
MSIVTIPIGCSIYSRTIGQFGKILRTNLDPTHHVSLVIQYDGKDSFLAEISDYEECVLDNVIVVYDKELTEQEKLFERLKFKN